jgi:hypothetical protein
MCGRVHRRHEPKARPTRGLVVALRRSFARYADQRQVRSGGRFAPGRALRDVDGRTVAGAWQFRGGQTQQVTARTTPPTASRPASTQAGNSTSSAPGAAHWPPAKRRRWPAPRAWATCGSPSPPKWRWLHHLRSAQARLAIASDNLASQLETLQITQWRLQAGLVTSLEAEQARAAESNRRAPIANLANPHRANPSCPCRADRPAAGRLVDSCLAAVRPVPQAADDLALSIPAETLRQRPDVRAAEHQVTAAAARW